MGLNARGTDLFKEIDRHPQVYIPHAVDGQTNRIFAGIKYPILAGAVVLELEQVVAVVQSVNILGFSGVNEFHHHFSF